MNAIICPECGAQNPVEASVCEQCNADLSAVKSVMDTANQHYNEALSLAHGGRLDEALAQIEAALALSAQNPEYHNLQGTIYAQKGLYSEAIRAWERCMTLDPEMEKAYKNVEKAKRMESESAEEQRKRPFLLTSIAASVVALVLLIITIYFGAQAYFANSRIDSLQTDLQVKSSQLSELTSKYKALNEKFPEGLDALLAKNEKLQTLADERQRQIQSLNQQRAQDAQSHNQQIALLQNQIQTLQKEKKELSDETQKIFGLKAQLTAEQSKTEALQTKLNERSQSLKQAHTDLEKWQEMLVAKNKELNTTRNEKDQVIYDLKQDQIATEEQFRKNVQELRDEIATLTREIADIKYADGLVAEALDNLEMNNFELAYQNVQEALKRFPEHTLANKMKNDLETILSDPIEQELRKQEKIARELQRIQKKNQLITRFLQQAEDYYDSGSYDKAIETAERAIALGPDPDESEKGKEIILEAEERNREITVMLLEAKKDLSENRTNDAERILKKVLRENPANQEAKQLLQQIENQ